MKGRCSGYLFCACLTILNRTRWFAWAACPRRQYRKRGMVPLDRKLGGALPGKPFHLQYDEPIKMAAYPSYWSLIPNWLQGHSNKWASLWKWGALCNTFTMLGNHVPTRLVMENKCWWQLTLDTARSHNPFKMLCTPHADLESDIFGLTV